MEKPIEQLYILDEIFCNLKYRNQFTPLEYLFKWRKYDIYSQAEAIDNLLKSKMIEYAQCSKNSEESAFTITKKGIDFMVENEFPTPPFGLKYNPEIYTGLQLN